MPRGQLYLCADQTGMELGKLIAKNLSEKMDYSAGIEQIICRPGKEQFAIGEFKIGLPSSVRGKDVFYITCPIENVTGWDVNNNLMRIYQVVDTLNNCHADSVTPVIPLFPYARQDQRKGREPRTALIIAACLGAVGTDAVITLDLHAGQIEGYLEAVGVKPDAPYASPIFLEWIHENIHDLKNWVGVPADHGGIDRTYFHIERIFEDPDEHIVYSIKDRNQTTANTVDSSKIIGSVQDKKILTFEDMVDTGGTIELLAYNATNSGAKELIVVATHASLSGDATSRLDKIYKDTCFTTLLTTNTVPHQQEYIKKHPWFKQLDVSEFLAEMIYRIHTEQETSSLYLKKDNDLLV
ncbi:MAG: Ribose-phosphate pyrophosphokinase [Candidatus Woesearchaeota archaeon]|nr:Ribose-phosphate pyrophosphokinase [Candidatus Woesearchaeota archaeon]